MSYCECDSATFPGPAISLCEFTPNFYYQFTAALHPQWKFQRETTGLVRLLLLDDLWSGAFSLVKPVMIRWQALIAWDV